MVKNPPCPNNNNQIRHSIFGFMNCYTKYNARKAKFINPKFRKVHFPSYLANLDNVVSSIFSPHPKSKLYFREYNLFQFKANFPNDATYLVSFIKYKLVTTINVLAFILSHVLIFESFCLQFEHFLSENNVNSCIYNSQKYKN